MSLPLSRARKALVALASAGLLAGFTAASPGASASAPERDTVPHWFGVRPTNGGVYATNGSPVGDARPGGGGGGGGNNGIFYNGGPVITAGVTAYYIWYGNWGSDTAPTILESLASHIGGSPYFNINTTYYNGSNVHVPNAVAFGGSTTDTGTKTSLSDADIQSIVASAITSGRLPKDANGVYFVLTAIGVNETSGFLTQYCGWHTHGTISGSDIKYSFVGDAGTNPSCVVQTSLSPNDNPGADGMANVIAHELEEATTDPDLNAWYDRRGYENADKCAWTFGTEYTTSNGATANMTLGTRDYLIQRNWVNAGGGYCSLSY